MTVMSGSHINLGSHMGYALLHISEISAYSPWFMAKPAGLCYPLSVGGRSVQAVHESKEGLSK